MLSEFEALERFCNSLSELWAITEFNPNEFEFSRPNCANTLVKDGALTLPKTGRPVRGSNEVEVRRSERILCTQEQVKKLVRRSYTTSVETFSSAELNTALLGVSNSLSQLTEVIDSCPWLSYVLFQPFGRKTYSFLEFEKAILSEKTSSGRALGYLHGLSEILAEGLVKFNFSPKKREEFNQWEKVCTFVCSELERYKKAENFSYEVRIFLNGPLIDFENWEKIATLYQSDRTLHIEISYASDELLLPLVEYETHPSIQSINTVLRYYIDLPIDGDETLYHDEYNLASQVAKCILLGFRLCRPKDDIGVLSLRIIKKTLLAPYICETYASHYHQDYARYTPRRFDFSSIPAEPLSHEEIHNLKLAIQLTLGIEKQDWRFQHAMNRFQNSFERYSLDDPEKILEYSIALESLYLGDTNEPKTELSYRIAIRAARILETDFEKRYEVFNIVKDLYNFRSKIAHGSDVYKIKNNKSNKKKDIDMRTRLNEIQLLGPEIVARSLLELLKLEKDRKERGISVSKFWREIELG